MSSCFSTIWPLGVFSWEILFFCLCWMVSLWKNLVFMSPSFNHVCWDFCLQRISSYFSSWASSWVNSPSLALSSSLYPSLMTWPCISPIKASNQILSSIMLPNVSLFHFFRLVFMCFNFCWKAFIWDSSGSSNPFHHLVVNLLKSRCVSQNFSNLNGLLTNSPNRVHSKHIGQWSELAPSIT